MEPLSKKERDGLFTAKVGILTSGGIGDCLMAFRCAEAVKRYGEYPVVFVAARDEVFKPLGYLTADKYLVVQVPEIKEEERQDAKFIEAFKAKYKINYPLYFSCPDNLFSGPYAFDSKKYNTSPSSIVQTKVLERWWKPKNIIYLALNSSTPEYQLGNRISQIVRRVALENPTKLIYFNNVWSWNGAQIHNGPFKDLPDNVEFRENQDFCESLDRLCEAEYVLAVDNGISHIANDMNIPMTLLDTRMDSRGIMWRARWRYNLDKSIPNHTDAISIAKLIKTNLEIPQTTLIPRGIVLENLDADWKNILLIKGY